MNSIHYNNCPVCFSERIHPIMTVKDHSVSQEEFAIWQCDVCSLRFTQDIPDQNEIGKYYQSENYISHSDTTKGLINRIYHWVRKRTLRKKRKLVYQLTGINKGVLLDVGSGTGAFASEMKNYGWQVTGIEPSDEARQFAKKVYGIELKNSEELSLLSADYFDAITLWHVLEHVHQLHPYIQQLKQSLKKNGKLIIAVPNYTSKDGEHYQENWAAYDVPRHLYHFSPQSMKVLLEKNQMKIIDCKPMWFDSFYISLLSSQYKNGKTSWLSAGWNGFVSNLAAITDKKKCSSVIYVIGKQD
jgi:2-polyprenyl-3-methyl-5-hydroxy-6-metoxy-1,4-benzoquinol methylase